MYPCSFRVLDFIFVASFLFLREDLPKNNKDTRNIERVRFLVAEHRMHRLCVLHSIRANVQFLRRDGRNRWHFGNPVEHCAIVQDRLSDPLHISRVHGCICVHRERIRNFLALNSANCLTIPPNEKRSYQFEFIVIKCLSSKDSFHSIVRLCISDRNLLIDISFPKSHLSLDQLYFILIFLYIFIHIYVISIRNNIK